MGKVLDSVGCNFSGSFEKEVGDGKSTKFWEDKWVGGEALKGKFPRLFNLETCKEVSIKDRGSSIENDWVWEWRWRRDPRGRELSEFSELCRILDNFKPKLVGVDKFVWKLDPVGGFSVKSLRGVLGERRAGLREVGVTVEPTRWDKSIPAKVNVFFWRASLGGLPCREVKALWLLVGKWWNLDVSNTGTLQDLLLTAVRSGSNSKGTAKWEAIIRCANFRVAINSEQRDACRLGVVDFRSLKLVDYRRYKKLPRTVSNFCLSTVVVEYEAVDAPGNCSKHGTDVLPLSVFYSCCNLIRCCTVFLLSMFGVDSRLLSHKLCCLAFGGFIASALYALSFCWSSSSGLVLYAFLFDGFFLIWFEVL
ncbi:hypothetical protein OSB04_000370 [Centaurea solstitialis]|uniref:Reverse transcriptase zinc-binding domain-containing protein n=1 Tax=Centaurea solstitialis TaxID=347529 RepID=A0AA38TP40_9ASTR|nr:hypothetical protein OSB04_000370 [Centaurea solstitialis]